MTTMNCERVSDLLPEYLNGQLDAPRVDAVRLHLAGCADCASERGVVARIQQQRVEPGEQLEQRIVAAVLHRGTPSRFRPQLALAATIALAVLGGGIVLARIGERSVAPSVQPVAEAEHHGPGWVGVDAALVSGAASLQDLSVEELEQLLVEAGS